MQCDYTTDMLEYNMKAKREKYTHRKRQHLIFSGPGNSLKQQNNYIYITIRSLLYDINILPFKLIDGLLCTITQLYKDILEWENKKI